LEENKNYTLYIHTNKMNNKKYIGITSQKPESRWRNNGNGYKECPKFYNAIMKYGWNNINHEIIKNNLTKKDAEELEIKYIKKYNTTNEKYGYNIQNGGNTTGTHSEETKRKIGEGNKGKIISKEAIEKMKKALKIRMKYELENDLNNRRFYVNNFINYVEKTKRKVINLDTYETFNSITEAGIKYNIHHSIVRKSCLDGRKHVGYRFAYYENYINNNIIIKEDGRKDARRQVICLNTLEIYESTLYIKKYLGIDVQKVCSNKRKSAGKHPETGEPLKWMYYDEYVKLKDKNEISIQYEMKIRKKNIIQLSLNNEFIKEWGSIKEAANKLNLNNSCICSCCKKSNKSSGNFKWMYKEDYEKYIEDKNKSA